MSRSALVLSLAIHGGVVALAGWTSLSIAEHSGRDRSAAGVAFSPADGGLLLAETAPATPPVETAPPAVEPAYSPPTPAFDTLSAPVATVDTSPPSISTAITGLPRDLPSLLPVQKKRSASRGSAPSTEAKSSARGGTPAGSGQDRGGRMDFTPPRFLLRYKPPYPEQARAQKLEGTVLLLVSVDAAGHVSGASIRRTCGHPVLDRAALEAVRSWRFVPAHRMERAEPATVEVPIRFAFAG